MGLFDNLFNKSREAKKVNILGEEREVNVGAMAFSQRGLDKYLQRDYMGAVAEFTNAIKCMPQNQNFYTMRGTAYEDMGKDAEAELDFRKTLELYATDFVAAYRLGMVYFRKKDFESAIKWLKVSYNNAPDVINMEHLGMGKNNILFIGKQVIAGNLGNFLVQQKQYIEGIKYLDEAIRLDPNYGNPYFVKGMAFAQMGKAKEGIPFVKKAAELGLPQAAGSLQMLEQMAKEEISNGSKEEVALDFVWRSSDHLRYQNGQHVSGPHGGAPRAIKVESNVNGGKGYTVTMFNIDGGKASIQMAPKQMELLHANNQKITLRGFGHDAYGASFDVYGLTIHHDQGEIQKIILHMHDRNVDIEYLP